MWTKFSVSATHAIEKQIEMIGFTIKYIEKREEGVKNNTVAKNVKF